MYKDGAGSVYNSTDKKFETVMFGEVASGSSRVANTVGGVTKYYEPFNFGADFAKKADNSVAGEMRDCGECHVGGGMMEYMIDDAVTTSATYDATKRKSLRDYTFGEGVVTAFNALIDIFNTDKTKRGEVVVQNYANTGVLEMDCLICHQKDYSWEKRRDAVRAGLYDASRAMGANLATEAVNGTTVFYNTTSVSATGTGGALVANLEYKIVAKPASEQCSSCHLGNSKETTDATTGMAIVTDGEKYQVDWKKRGEMWSKNGTVLDVHGAIGCMGCHERTGSKVGDTVGVDGKTSTAKLGLCDPAKGGVSPFDAMWNPLDKKEFKDCAGCHEYTTAPTFSTFGAPASKGAHDRAGLTAKIAYNAAGENISHIDLIDCTACHIRKDGFSGGAFVDGTGADEQGRLTIHDTEYVAKADMGDGVAVHWQAGKIYAANLLTSFFWRDMNGLKTANGGLDANNDGREAGMDPPLQTHVNNINIANDLHGLTHDGIVTAAEIKTHAGKLTAGLPAQLGLAAGVVIAATNADGTPNLDATNAFLPKLSFLMVPFKASHNIAGADRAWGKNGCKECHSAPGVVAGVKVGGFYNGAYPINGNMEGKFSFNSNQVATFTKVNGLTDITDSHPNVRNKLDTRTIPIPILTKFDNAYVQTATTGQTLRNIDRSEVLYENTFQTINQEYVTEIQGGEIKPACNSKSPFYCEDAAAIFNVNKKGSTSTLGWLLKIDVEGVGSRTVQVTNDKVTTVETLASLLNPAGGDYFTVTAVNKTTGLPAVGAEVNNSLKIAALGAYKIRINKASYVGPFGLAGALWTPAPIVRGANSYATRADYVAYLNSIDAAAFGVGQAPVAGIAAVAGETGSAAAPLVKGTSYDLAATGTPAAGAAFKWATNAGTAAVISDDTAAAPTVTFSKPGTFRVALTVTNVDGATATSYKLVNVKNPVLVTFTAPATTTVVNNVAATATKPAYSYTTVTTKVPASVEAGVVYDSVRFFWGDGSAPTTLSAADFATAMADGGLAHKYNRYTKYFKTATGKYTYKTTVQLFNTDLIKGKVLVNSQSVIVEVP